MTERDLFEAYNREVYRTCYYMLHNAADAEDVCQDVFMTAFRSNWAQIEYLKTWLMRITVNLCLNHLKKIMREQARNRKLKLQSKQSFEAAAETIAEQHESTEECIRLLQQLPSKIRAVVSLRYINEYSLIEIADILGIPVGTVKSRLHKGVHMMKQRIVSDESNYNQGGDQYGQDRTNVYSIVKG